MGRCLAWGVRVSCWPLGMLWSWGLEKPSAAGAWLRWIFPCCGGQAPEGLPELWALLATAMHAVEARGPDVGYTAGTWPWRPHLHCRSHALRKLHLLQDIAKKAQRTTLSCTSDLLASSMDKSFTVCQVAKGKYLKGPSPLSQSRQWSLDLEWKKVQWRVLPIAW